MSFNKEVTRSALDELNRIARKLGIYPSRRKNPYIYWFPPKDWEGTIYLFAYTPWKTNYEGKEGFFVLKFRLLKNGNHKLVKVVRFGRRKIAKARSLKWYDKYYKKEE